MMKVPLSEALFVLLLCWSCSQLSSRIQSVQAERRLHASVKSEAGSADTKPGEKRVKESDS